MSWIEPFIYVVSLSLTLLAWLLSSLLAAIILSMQQAHFFPQNWIYLLKVSSHITWQAWCVHV